ncbi:KRAB-A domain-containing protein 2 [Trichonephila inaurata madagascariensis]|uniref:KRAB-A domain-containing protein 2 n=1 Tax=Trichonephila inaurata madagascariensis TaxID=2747483 RepID=A0A8X6WQZ8_9ARAC|nr:KRAB-A domain-containing protein 2 [Trichonephila inaurata madagascariensis]
MSILQSDNGREFTNNLVTSLKEFWSVLMIVHRKPRHSHSQGISERVNQDIENKFCTWMSDNQCDRWSEGLCILQLTKNRAYHSEIKRITHEALLGCKSKVRLMMSFCPKIF